MRIRFDNGMWFRILIGRIGCFLRLVCSLTGHGNPAGWNVNSNQVTFLEATTAPRGEWTPRAARHTLRRYQAPSVQCGKCGMCKCRAAATDCDPCGDTARVGSRTVEADGQSRMLDMQDVRDMLLHPCLLWLIECTPTIIQGTYHLFYPTNWHCVLGIRIIGACVRVGKQLLL